MVSTAWIIENIKKTNSWVNNRAYAEKSLSDFLEFAVDTRIENPTLTQNWTVLNQRQIVDVNDRNKILAGRGSAYFDKIEKMIQTESHIIGIFGSKYNSGSRLLASKQIFNNLINTDIGESNPNFSIYNNKIKAEKQKIIDIENNRLAEIENVRIQQEEFVKNARLEKIKQTQILKENNDLLREQLFAKQFQEDLEVQQNSFIEPVLVENLFKDVTPEIKTEMIIQEKQVSILPVENNSMYIIAGLGLIAGLIALRKFKK